MQVIHELRNGVKLRKVCDIADIYDRRNIEYELTPFEILLDQIRARRYHLKKVTVRKRKLIKFTFFTFSQKQTQLSKPQTVIKIEFPTFI